MKYSCILSVEFMKDEPITRGYEATNVCLVLPGV
jgi:hypothetical protein